MDVQELEIMSLWIETALSALSVVLFLFASWQVYQLAKHYSMRKAKQHETHRGQLSPLATKPSRTQISRVGLWGSPHQALRIVRKKSILSRFRSSRIRQFQQISLSLIRDVNEFFHDAEHSSYEARTMLPLVAEARLLGEKLLSERKKLHKMLNGREERLIEYTIHDLLIVENKLRSIPRAAYTLEEVVEGRFEHVVSK